MDISCQVSLTDKGTKKNRINGYSAEWNEVQNNHLPKNIVQKKCLAKVNVDNKPSFILFIRNGAGRKHTYLKCYFNREKFQLKKGMVVSISGHIENINTKNCYEIIIDTIQEEQTELAVFFNKKPSFGFAYPNHFAKMFVFGKVIDKHLKPNTFLKIIRFESAMWHND